MSHTDTSHDRCPASSLARPQKAPTSLHPARDSPIPPYRKYIRESSHPTSASPPPHAKNQCPLRRRPSPTGFSPRQPAPPSSETIPVPANRTSASRDAPFCLRKPARFPEKSSQSCPRLSRLPQPYPIRDDMEKSNAPDC